jgi:hypothetical protein
VYSLCPSENLAWKHTITRVGTYSE